MMPTDDQKREARRRAAVVAWAGAIAEDMMGTCGLENEGQEWRAMVDGVKDGEHVKESDHG